MLSKATGVVPGIGQGRHQDRDHSADVRVAAALPGGQSRAHFGEARRLQHGEGTVLELAFELPQPLAPNDFSQLYLSIAPSLRTKA